MTKIYIKKPTFKELDYIQKLWLDEKTMEAVDGTHFLEDRRQSWFEKNVEPTDGQHFYTLIQTNTDVTIGEISFDRYDTNTKAAKLNTNIVEMDMQKKQFVYCQNITLKGLTERL